MPSWNEILKEMHDCRRKDAHDFIRNKYLQELQKKSERNIICYYSGWLQKPRFASAHIDDNDKNALMAAVHRLNRKIGLDLVLHTPGGDLAAAESLVDYLRKMFELDIRAIIPQIAMSAGTMIACATKEIIMGKQSNIGPFDPQFNGISAHGVIEEFERALRETKEDPATIPIWQVVVSKYHPAFIGDCEKAIDWSKEIVQKWLITGMFKDDPEGKQKAKRIAEQLSDHRNTKSHSRHIHILEARRLGLVIKSLEADFDQGFQDLVLTVHHAYMHTLANTTAAKIIENHLGNAIVMHHNP